MKRLIELYECGAITADHVASECLHILNPADPGSVLGPLPESVLLAVAKYAGEYQPGKMRSNYPILPAVDQIEAAKDWIASKRLAKAV